MRKAKTSPFLLAAALVSAIGIILVAQYLLPNVIYLTMNPRDPVYSAVSRRDSQALRELIEEGRDLNAIVDETSNPLFLALMRNDWVNAKLLLDHGARLDIKAQWQSKGSEEREMIDYVHEVARDSSNRYQFAAAKAIAWLSQEGYRF